MRSILRRSLSHHLIYPPPATTQGCELPFSRSPSLQSHSRREEEAFRLNEESDPSRVESPLWKRKDRGTSTYAMHLTNLKSEKLTKSTNAAVLSKIVICNNNHVKFHVISRLRNQFYVSVWHGSLYHPVLAHIAGAESVIYENQVNDILHQNHRRNIEQTIIHAPSLLFVNEDGCQADERRSAAAVAHVKRETRPCQPSRSAVLNVRVKPMRPPNGEYQAQSFCP